MSKRSRQHPQAILLGAMLVLAPYLATVPAQDAPAPLATAKPYAGKPFGGKAAAIPGRIEAENFDLGGEGVGYHDRTTRNQGGGYRKDEAPGIKGMEAIAGKPAWYKANDGSPTIGWFFVGEWLQYTVDVTPGVYDIKYRIATPMNGKSLELYLDGAPLATLPVPNTGEYTKWETRTVKNIKVEGSGRKVLRLIEAGHDKDEVDVNWIEFVKAASAEQTLSQAPPELIFQSGFEADCKVVPLDESHDDIVGKDATLPEKSDWVKDLEEWAGIRQVRTEYTGGDVSKRYVKIIPEPGNPANHVLQFWLGDTWMASEHMVKGRVQVDFYGMQEGLKEFYQSVRVFLPEELKALRRYPGRINWCTIAEFWNNTWWGGNKNGFRVSLGIGKPTAAESDLEFILDAQDPGMKRVWGVSNHKVKVPIGKWFTMEYYFREGDSKSGRFFLAITPEGGQRQVVYDVTGFTHNTKDPSPDGLTDYNPMKLYTSKELVGYMRSQGKALQVYWDDFQLWKNKRP